jgi:hypothetical protein
MANLLTFLSGKKTYLVSIGVLIYAIGINRGWWQHQAEIDLMFGGAGAMTIRAAIKKLCLQISNDPELDEPVVPGKPLISRAPIVALLLIPALFFAGCAQGPVMPGSPVAIVGGDFQEAAAEALQAYADYKAGNGNLVWAMQKMFNAYSLYGATSTDVKALIKAWAGSGTDGQTLADKLARIFGDSPHPPDVKMAALAEITQAVASNKDV